jgi:hypothetical protein
MSNLKRDLTDPNYLRSIGVDEADIPAAIITENRARAAAHDRQAKEATEFAYAARQAVISGEMTPAEAALALRVHPAAHDAFVAAWATEERMEQNAERALELLDMNAESYLDDLEIEQERATAAREEAAQAEADRTGLEVLEEAKKQFADFLGTVPGTHAHAERIAARLLSTFSEQGVGTTPELREKQIVTAVHELGVADGLTEQLVAQVEVDWRAHEHARKQRQFTERAPDDRNAVERANDERDWKANRLEQLAASTLVPTSVLELPPSAEEQTAAEVTKIAARNERDDSFAKNAGGMFERGVPLGERGSTLRTEQMTSDKNAYREATKRAEEAAAFGNYAPVKTAYPGSTEGAEVTQEQVSLPPV